MPFIPDYIPAVGDIDAFLKVIPPEPFTKDSKLPEFISKLGLEVLDEPVIFNFNLILNKSSTITFQKL